MWNNKNKKIEASSISMACSAEYLVSLKRNWEKQQQHFLVSTWMAFPRSFPFCRYNPTWLQFILGYFFSIGAAVYDIENNPVKLLELA